MTIDPATQEEIDRLYRAIDDFAAEMKTRLREQAIIGGYQVCHKWLKGRTLTDDDITHYQKIIIALNETIRLMKEIDEVIERHGGWPGAFTTEKVDR